MYNLEKQTADQQEQYYLSEQLKEKSVIVTIHDACPFFSDKIFNLADELENLKIKFNISLVPFFKPSPTLSCVFNTISPRSPEEILNTALPSPLLHLSSPTKEKASPVFYHDLKDT